MHLLPFLPKLALSRFFLKSIKNDFWPEKGRISFILFYNRLGNTCGLNPSEKDREKHCFLILSLLSHNLTGKLIFSQKRVSKATFVFFLFLMLSNVDFNAFKLHFWCFTTGPKHPKCWNWKTIRLLYVCVT